MTNDQRIQRRIQRDKQKRLQRKLEKQRLYGDFEKIFTMQNFIKALKKCQKNVSWKGSVQTYSKHSIIKMIRAKNALMKGQLNTTKMIRKMVLYERGKRREINAVRIDDRHIQRVLCDEVLLPMIKDSLIYDNGASMEGKGVEFARRRLNVFLQRAVRKYKDNFYILTFDFKSFFDSIKHSVCLEELNKHFMDKRIVGLSMKIIKMYCENDAKSIIDESERKVVLDILRRNQGTGLTLGSQVSQIMALLVPNRIDHFLKDVCGLKWYIRYMDDGVIIYNDKQQLLQIVKQLEELCNSIGLKLNVKKTRIVKCTHGFKFMKVHYRIKGRKIIKTIDKSGNVRMRRKLKKFQNLVQKGIMDIEDVYNSMQSRISHMKIARTYHARRNLINKYNILFNGYKIRELMAL